MKKKGRTISHKEAIQLYRDNIMEPGRHEDFESTSAKSGVIIELYSNPNGYRKPVDIVLVRWDKKIFRNYRQIFDGSTI